MVRPICAHAVPAHRILLVEDDAALARQIVATLEKADFATTWIADGESALRTPLTDVHLVILDLMLPKAHGLDVLKHVRSQSDVPVLILSARNETRDKVRALEIGADDFVTKPFWPEELLARVQTRLRRPLLQRAGTVTVGDLTIDFEARRVHVAETAVDLTRAEFELLATLARRPGSALSRTTLVERALDPERYGTERTLDVHISRLRKKLGACGGYVATVWGVGYRLQTGAEGERR